MPARRVRRWLARQGARPGLRSPLAPLVALVAAGTVLVVHGEPRPVQQYSGVSVPVATESSDPAAVRLPALLTLSGGVLLRIDGELRSPVALPSDATPLSVQQVSAGASAALVLRPDGQHAILLPSGGAAVDLGLAARIVPGALPAVVALERDGSVLRFGIGGEQVGEAVALPVGMALGADSSLGVVASTVVGPIAQVEVGAEPPAAEVLAGTRTALQRGALWLPIGPYQPLAVSGAVALLWDPLAGGLGLLDLRRLAILQPVEADQLPGTPIAPTEAPADPAGPDPAPTDPPAPSPTASSPTASSPTAQPTAVPIVPVLPGLLPVPYPALRGIAVTGPAAFSADGKWIAIAGQVGDRPRLVLGAAPPSIVRGQIELAALNVLSLGGTLAPGQAQPSPVWSRQNAIAARVDGTVVVYSTLTRQAVVQTLGPAPSAGPTPAPTTGPTGAPSTGPPPTDPAGAPTSGSAGSGGGAAVLLAGLGIG